MARKKRAFERLGVKKLLLAAFAVSFIECSLILLRIIPPILSYSPANMVAAFAYFVLLAFGGWEESLAGMKAAAKAGALIASGRLSAVIAAAIIGFQLGIPVIGMAIPSGLPLAALYAIIALENMLVGATIAVAFALIGGFLKKKIGKNVK